MYGIKNTQYFFLFACFLFLAQELLAQNSELLLVFDLESPSLFQDDPEISSAFRFSTRDLILGGSYTFGSLVGPFGRITSLDEALEDPGFFFVRTQNLFLGKADTKGFLALAEGRSVSGSFSSGINLNTFCSLPFNLASEGSWGAGVQLEEESKVGGAFTLLKQRYSEAWNIQGSWFAFPLYEKPEESQAGCARFALLSSDTGRNLLEANPGDAWFTYNDPWKPGRMYNGQLGLGFEDPQFSAYFGAQVSKAYAHPFGFDGFFSLNLSKKAAVFNLPLECGGRISSLDFRNLYGETSDTALQFDTCLDLDSGQFRGFLKTIIEWPRELFLEPESTAPIIEASFRAGLEESTGALSFQGDYTWNPREIISSFALSTRAWLVILGTKSQYFRLSVYGEALWKDRAAEPLADSKLDEASYLPETLKLRLAGAWKKQNNTFGMRCNFYCADTWYEDLAENLALSAAFDLEIAQVFNFETSAKTKQKKTKNRAWGDVQIAMKFLDALPYSKLLELFESGADEDFSLAKKISFELKIAAHIFN